MFFLKFPVFAYDYSTLYLVFCEKYNPLSPKASKKELLAMRI